MIPPRQKYPVQIIHSNCCDLAESSHGNEYFLRDSSADPPLLVNAGVVQPTEGAGADQAVDAIEELPGH